MSEGVVESAGKAKIDLKRLCFTLLGVFLFIIVFYSPPWPDAIDPVGKHFPLSPEGKGAIAVFLLAGIWWVFEVIPIGITSLAIGVLQALFFIRPAKEAFNDFMDPAVLFIFSCLMIGLVFTKTGLTKRMAFKMLSLVGEKTTRIYLGIFILITILTHFMAHTAVAATIFPLLLSINSLYGEGDKPTRFGKGLFIGMAYVCGAGSIISLLGSARAIVALGFFKEMAGVDTPFYLLTYYMAPVGWLMVFLLWIFFVIFLKPEKKVIPGLKDRIVQLSADLGPISKKEVYSLLIIFGAIVFMSLQVTLPSLQKIDKTAIILIASVLFFALKILDMEDRRRPMARRSLASDVPACSLVGICFERGSLRTGPYQFHHERRGHCHFSSRCPGHFRLFRSISPRRHVFLPYDGWDALYSLGRRCAKCHRLCFQTVH
jgi:sodium-dependent dicarboxylate transporter 2/3/5